jgi:signal transduction histidine kinase
MRIDQSEFHDHLVRGLTHKMNNILSLFHGYLGLLIEDKKLDRDVVAGLIRIRDGADAASRLMDRTKAFAAPSAAPAWREVAADEFLRSFLPALQLHADRGVRLQVDCEPGLPQIWADTSRLRVALKEIVKNAFEASPAHGVVTISVKSQARAAGVRAPRNGGRPLSWVVINVTDSGKGIPAELREKVFHPFFSTKNKRDSMGLGLSVALGLTQQLGGAIRIQSKPGKTTVKFILPARAIQQHAA